MSREQLLELAAGMREAADWIEQNADLPIKPSSNQPGLCLRAEGRDEVSAVARAMGSFEKVTDSALSDWYYIIRKCFRTVPVDLHCDRAKICRKVKVMKEVDDWVCEDSILAPELPVQA